MKSISTRLRECVDKLTWVEGVRYVIDIESVKNELVSIRADVDALAEEMREAPWKHGDACSTFCDGWAAKLSEGK